MLALSNESSKTLKRKRCSPNVLPCRIHHDGPVEASKRYWDPKAEADGSKTAYFRGRKLRGRQIMVPEGYRGVVLNKTDRVTDLSPNKLSQESGEEDVDSDEDEKSVETLLLDEEAEFQDLTVWGHDDLPDEKESHIARGVTEWVKFAQAIHSFESNSATVAAPKPMD